MAEPRVTFLRGRELVNVAGESHYQDALRQITGGAGEGPVRQEATAHLIPEPDNEYDPNAVRVEIDGRKVGYLPRALAVEYTPLLAPIVARRRVAACEAMIAGDRGSSSLGVFLRLPPPTSDAVRHDVSRRF